MLCDSLILMSDGTVSVHNAFLMPSTLLKTVAGSLMEIEQSNRAE